MSTTTHPTPSRDAAAGLGATLVRAIEARDGSAVAATFADDATLTLYDRDHPPTAPQVFRGSAEIEAYFEDICGRNLEHRVEDLVETPTGLSYVQQCRYPSGEQVVCVASARVRDGRIVAQTGIQVWDD